MAEFPQSVKIYAYLGSTWTDVTTDVVEDISGFWGIGTNRETDRVAAVGVMYFTLNNTSTKYTPNIVASLVGWGKGTKIKLVIRYRDRDHIRFKGVVDSIKITGGVLGLRQVYVTVKDWMDYATKYPLQSPGIQLNKRADEGLTTIKNAMPIAPDSFTFATGDETFPNIFDTVTKKTTAIGEFNKFALSEMGYIYLRKDWTSGENLRFDNRRYRKGTDTPTTYSVPAANSGFLLKEDGGYLLLETGDKLILESAETLALSPNNDMQNVEVEYGANVLNRITVVAYPRRVDTSLAVLFSLGYPMQIGAGETTTFRGTYFDPTGGAVVNADSTTMVTPTATTDYLMNTKADGTGTNKTSSLTITAVYGTEGVTYTLTNTDTATCYITKLQARGYGIYTYATLESIVENSDSYNTYGYSSEVLPQMYQQNTVLGKIESARILENYRAPRTILNKVYLQGNKSTALLWGFLMYDVGDMVNVKESQTGVDSDYYIQGINFQISQAQTGGIIDYSWNVKQAQTLSSGDYGLSLIGVEFSNLADDGQILYFDPLNYLNNLQNSSMSMWIKSTGTANFSGFLADGKGSNSSHAWSIKVNVSSSSITTINYYQYGGQWVGTPAAPVSISSNYVNIIVTKNTVSINTPPIIYINGVSVTVTSTADVQTSILSEDGVSVQLGGRFSFTVGGAPLYLDTPFVRIKDFRIYNVILSASQALGIYNEGAGGTGYLSSLQLQAPAIKKADLTYYTDHTMLSSDALIDNVYGVIAKAKWGSTWHAPITRLP